MKHKYLFIGLFFLFQIVAKPVYSNQNPNYKLVVEKLEESIRQQNFSLELAHETCLEALDLCKGLTNDTLQVNILIQLGGISTLQGKNKEALKLFQKALKISQSTTYEKGICISFIELGHIYYDWGQYDFAVTFFKKSLNIAIKNNFKQHESISLNKIGKYYHTKGDFKKSVEYYEKALEVAHQLKDYEQTTSMYLNLGKTYISEEDFYMTLSYYLKAYENSQQSENKLIKADVLNHLGSIYLLLKQPNKSLQYHRKALGFREEMNSPREMATSCNNLGETFLSIASYDSASIYLQRSHELCHQTGYKKGIVKALTNLGRVGNKTGKLSKANKYLDEALSLSQKVGYDAGVVESSITLGENFLLKKNYGEAISYFELSLSQMIPAKLTEFQTDAYQGLFDCHKALGNTKKALEYHMELIQSERNKLQAQNDRQLAELRVTFDLERQENENIKLRHENDLKQLALTKRNWIIWLCVIILIFTITFCFLIYFRYKQKREAHSQSQKLNQQLELANKEKDKMFSIIAHELRNPLYWFQNLTDVLSKKHQNMTAQRLQKSLYAVDESAKNAFHLMDNLLNWSRASLKRISPKKANHELNELICETMNMFESIIHEKEIQTTINVQPGIHIFADADLFNCILRNLASNAIKYTPEKGKISIDASTDNRFCTISVCDSGIGLAHNEIPSLFTTGNFDSAPGLMQEKGSGLGLKVCKEFTQLNDGKIWGTSNQEQGTCFYFTVPLRKSSNTQ